MKKKKRKFLLKNERKMKNNSLVSLEIDKNMLFLLEFNNIEKL
jgi:hypothetical protein